MLRFENCARKCAGVWRSDFVLTNSSVSFALAGEWVAMATL